MVMWGTGGSTYVVGKVRKYIQCEDEIGNS